MAAGWGPWQPGIEYWDGTSYHLGSAEWRWLGDTGDTIRDDALAAVEWNKAISGSEVVRSSGVTPLAARARITYIGWDGVNEHYRYESDAQRRAYGFNSLAARYSLPVPPAPPDASWLYEYEEVDEDGIWISQYLGEARLNVWEYYLVTSSTGPPIDAQLDLRVFPGTLADLDDPGLEYDSSGVTVWSTGQVGSWASPIAGPSVADISEYADPVDGEFILVTAADEVTGWTPPPGYHHETPEEEGDWYRGIEADFYTTVEYKCLTPRFRWWYDELPPEPEITPVTVVRQYPRDDQYGLGSAPRLHPPSRRGRVVGGLQ